VAGAGAGRDTLLANVAGALGCALTGGSIVATRFVVGQTDPVTLAFLRYLIAALCLAPVTVLLWRRDRPPLRDLAAIAGLGLAFFGLFPWLFTLSLEFTTAARGALALATTPLIALVIATVLGMERFGTVKLAAVLTAVIGVVIALSGNPEGLNAAGPDYWIGDLVMLGAAVIAAAYSVGAKPLLARHPALLVTCLSMIAGVIGLAVPTGILAARHGLPQFDTAGLAAVAFLGVGGGALQFGLWVWAVGRLTPTHASLFLTLTPVTAMILGVIVLGEAFTAALLIGLILVVAGLLGINWRPQPWRG
jgi:drug/metabolite transporter (DMT)-like permease